MKIRDGFKFGLGWAISDILLATMRLFYRAYTIKDAKAIEELNRMAACLKLKPIVEPEPNSKPCKNKIGFTIE